MQFGFSTARSPEMASVIGYHGQQLAVTPEVVVSKINNMKENKSPGVDGISPKILHVWRNSVKIKKNHSAKESHPHNQ